MVGSPALDAILNEPLIPRENVIQKFSIDDSKPLILVVQHPITTEADKAGEQMAETMEAIVELDYPVILLYPNSDAGGRRIIQVIKDYEKMYTFIKTFKSLPRREYLSLLKFASVLVGNSSSGIIDAPSFCTPVVNIGSRQEGRERGSNVLDVGYNREDIKAAINKAVNDQEFLAVVKKCKSPYGDGKAGLRIAKVLSELEINPRLLQKKITY